MDLSDKLNYYRQNAQPEKPAVDQAINNLAEKLGGTLLDPAAPAIIKTDINIPFDQMAYDWPEAQVQRVRLPSLTKKQVEREIALNEILVFDLETTGLAGGTGTFAFLVGIGLFHQNHLQVIQYFLPDYGREVPVFLELKELMRDRGVILSYNGKSYDYPLLRNRFILNRVDDPFATAEHLDLLHPVRRLWKPLLGQCSLENVEREIFRFHRVGDIDGSLIPYAYFDFLRSGETDDIRRILNHNQQDIISLARLLIQLHGVENDPARFSRNPEEILMLLRQAVKNEDLPAAQFYRDIARSQNIPLVEDILVSYSLLYKRRGEWQSARTIWEELLNRGREIPFACEELAKYYEHHTKEYSRASALCTRALQYLDMMEELSRISSDNEMRESFVHRQQRLNRKLNGEVEGQ
jgi:uncharacterized protein YprB with RNaseH-like and TPR domain